MGSVPSTVSSVLVTSCGIGAYSPVVHLLSMTSIVGSLRDQRIARCMTLLCITCRCILVNVPPQPRDPETAAKLVAAAARLLAGEGRGALTARRLGAEVGASSMAVYTYFGGMDELLRAVWRRGFLD